MSNVYSSGMSSTSLSLGLGGTSQSIALPFSVQIGQSSYTSADASASGGLNLLTTPGLGNLSPIGAVITALNAPLNPLLSGAAMSYGSGTYAGHQAFGVTWQGVHENGSSGANTFQILLVDRSDTGAGNADVYLNYDLVSTGSSVLPNVSYNLQLGQQGSSSVANTGLTLPGVGLNALTSVTDDSTPGQYLFQLRGGSVINTLYSIAAVDAAKVDALAGITPYTFLVSRQGDLSQSADLTYSVSGSGSAPASSGLFALPSGAVHFAAGASTASISVGVNGASLSSDQGFTVSLAGVPGILSAAASGTIQANNGTTPTPTPVPTPTPTPVPTPTPTPVPTPTPTPVPTPTPTPVPTPTPTPVPTPTPTPLPTPTPTPVPTPVSIPSPDPNDPSLPSTPSLPSLPSVPSILGPDVPQVSDTSGGTSPFAAGVNGPISGGIPAGIPSDFVPVSPTAINVYRFFNTSNGTHFYTISAGEVASIDSHDPNLVSEGSGFLAVNPTAAANDSNAISVYRFFDKDTGSQFFTASAQERDNIIGSVSRLTYEGVGFQAHTDAEAGDTAVYRFFDTNNGSHVYTVSAAERASIAATRPDLTYEGVSFYAPTA